MSGWPQRIYLSKPHLCGEEMGWLARTLESNWITTEGENLDRLEREFESMLSRPCLAVVNGTSAIHLALRLCGVGEGDEVFCSSLTFVGCANPILYLGARPVFVDSCRTYWTLDPELTVEALKRRARNGRLPKALIVVHLFGQPADLDPLLAACREYGVAVIEDVANALGGYYRGKPLGSFGDYACFSFNGNKIITGGGGGLLAAATEEGVGKARHWATQAKDPGPDYLHSEMGYNYRMSNVNAAIVLAQLNVLRDRVRKRRSIFEIYRSAFGGMEGMEAQQEFISLPEHSPSESECAGHTRWLSAFLIDETRFGVSAQALVSALAAANIEARPVWKPLHAQRLFARAECVGGGGTSEDLNRRGVCFPSSSSLSEKEQEFVIRQVDAARRKEGKPAGPFECDLS